MSISVTKLFGLEGDRWLRHANPVSVWTRFAVLPLLALAVWSREWIGWWSLAAVALVLVFMVLLYEDMKARDPEYAGCEH